MNGCSLWSIPSSHSVGVRSMSEGQVERTIRLARWTNRISSWGVKVDMEVEAEGGSLGHGRIMDTRSTAK